MRRCGRNIQAIHPHKDVDGFHPQNVGAMCIGQPCFLPCTPAGIVELLKRSDIDIEGKECVVVGRSNIVGKPMSLLMLRENATVTITHSRTKNLKEVCRRADILIAAVGKPKMITADYVKEGAVVIDVGIHRNENNKLCGDVDFENVCFSYSKERNTKVLKNINLHIKQGQTVGIIGGTGSAKSSLVQLLQRLYTCRSGEILIDGVNINDIERHHLRRNIGIVLQEPFLYSRTIMENVRIVNPDAADEEVFDATRVASLHDVIQSFENGYDTVVGEKGVTLSGGQKQRVAIARMLMQKAPIIVLDDSMSAVDTETDAAIRDALHSRRSSCTTFIISHRITTLCRADKILVLEGGRLVQMGTHEELLKQDGLYKRIADIQNLLEDELRSEQEEN